jgi:hypothetical protein
MNQFFCFGGPLDGERIRDRGLFFTTVAQLAEVRDGVVGRPGWSSGVYERRADGYHWCPG